MNHHQEQQVVMLSIPVIHKILGFIDPDLKNIVHREGNTFFDIVDNRLPLSLIMRSNLEDYFEPVLLSDRFKDNLCDECAKRGELHSLMWARSKGCPWTIPMTALEFARQTVVSDFGRDYMGILTIVTLEDIAETVCYSNSDYESQIQTGACYLAAQAGHLHILEWARNNGSEWNEATCMAAAKAGRWNIAKWCIDHGCPCSQSLRTKIRNKAN